MDRKVLLDKFNNEFIIPRNFEAIIQMDKFCKKNKSDLAQKMKNSFIELFKQIEKYQDRGLKDEIKVITLSVSRTYASFGEYRGVICAFDEKFYFDKNPLEVEVDLSEYFVFYNKMQDELMVESKKYVGLINRSDVQKSMQQQFNRYVAYITNICRLVIRDIEHNENFLKLKRHEYFVIYAGEHKNNFQIVYTSRNCIADQQEMAANIIDNHKEIFIQECFCKVDLQKKDFRNIKLEYSFLNESNLCYSDFYLGIIIGTSFRDCAMRYTNFKSSVIIDCDFENADLQNSCFEKSFGATTKPSEVRLYSPGFLGVNFKSANLNKVSFKEADLTCANFENAKFAENDFTDTILKEAVFNIEHLKLLELSEQQLEEIIII